MRAGLTDRGLYTSWARVCEDQAAQCREMAAYQRNLGHAQAADTWSLQAIRMDTQATEYYTRAARHQQPQPVPISINVYEEVSQ